MKAVVVLLSVLLLCGLSKAEESVLINDEIEQILSAVNEAVEVTGLNYVPLRNSITIMDAKLSEIYIGDVSTWKRGTDFFLTAGGLGDFHVSGTVKVASLQMLANSLKVGANYTGLLSLLSLDNTLHLGFNVTDRFGPACDSKVTQLALSALSDTRLYTPDGKGAGLYLEKTLVIKHIKEFFEDNYFHTSMKDVLTDISTEYFCKGVFHMYQYFTDLKSKMKFEKLRLNL